MKQLFLITILLCVVLTTVSAGAQGQTAKPAIVSISVAAKEQNQEQLIFRLNGSLTPKIFRLKGERPRLVLDFADTAYLGKVDRITDTGTGIIAGVRVGRHTNPAKTRVVVDISRNVDFQHEEIFNVSNNTLIITFSPGQSAELAEQSGPPGSPQYVRLESKKIVHSKEPAGNPTAAAQPPQPPTQPPQPPTQPPQPPAQPPQPPVTREKPGQPEKPVPPVISIAADEKKRVVAVEPEAGAASAEDRKKPATVAAAEKQPATAVETKQKPAPESKDTADSQLPPVLLDVAFEKSINRRETVFFRLNNFFPPLVFGIEQGEPQVVCDFLDATIGPDVASTIQSDGDFISRIGVSSHADPAKVRVILSLVPNRHYDLQQLYFKEDNLFVIIVSELKAALQN